jgi:hypothetical protein
MDEARGISAKAPRGPAPAPRDRPSKPPRRKRPARRSESEGRGFPIAINSSIITGMAMMLGATVWFVLGLGFGYIFFYPPIMFLLGIGAIIRGFTGRD